MPLRLGRTAPGGGGTARMSASAPSEAPNVATSIRYVIGRPRVAIRIPPTAGPVTMPMLPRKESSALAATSSWRSTRRGVSASSGGRWRPSSPAMSAPTTKRTQSFGLSSVAFSARIPAQSASEASAIWTSRRRSKASASAPPTKAVTSSGPSSARLRRPTTSDEPESWYAWYGRATYVIIEPKKETPWPKKRRRKSRCRFSGPMSIVASFSAERTRPGSGTGGAGPRRSASRRSSPLTEASCPRRSGSTRPRGRSRARRPA